MSRLQFQRIERERTDKPNLCGEDGQVILGQYRNALGDFPRRDTHDAALSGSADKSRE